MLPKSPRYSDVLDRQATRIVQDLTEARQLLEHNPSLGAVVEQTVSKMISQFIPTSCEVTSGFAANKEGKLSQQQDILVVRSQKIGPLRTYAGFGVYPIENVLAAIEVKTKLTISELGSAMDTLGGLVALSPDISGESNISAQSGNLLTANIPKCRPFTAVFSIETDIATGRILHDVQNHQSNAEISTRLNAVQVLGHSITCWVDKTAKSDYPTLSIDPQATNVAGVGFDWEKRPLQLASSSANENQSLKTMLGLLLGFLDWYRPPPIDLSAYLLHGLKLKFDVAAKPPSA